MNSWEIGERVIANKKIEADEMITDFMKGLDEFHFKDVFREHYRAVKEYGKKHYQQAEPELFQISGDTDTDPLAFPYAGKKYLAIEQYCTNLECPCNSVTLNFVRLTSVKYRTPEFVIVLHLGTLQYEVKQHSCDPEKIFDIVKCFLDKRGVLETLRYRYREMKKDGGKSQRQRAEDKLHNNQPAMKMEPKIGRIP